MGVNLSELIEPKEISIESLLDKKIAVDAFNWLYQFLSIIRQPDGTPLKDSRGRVTSHLSGLFYRSLKLTIAGVKLVYVFDGKTPEFKKTEKKRRMDLREQARQEWKRALGEGRVEDAEKFAKRSSQITEDIINDSKQLLDAMGIPWIQAETEGEAQCAYMTKTGIVDYSASQDYDSLLFGAPKLIRNLSISGRKKRGLDYITVNPEIVELDQVLKTLGINQNELIILGILTGTDYNPAGAKGIGPKKALKLVKENNFDQIIATVEWDSEVDPKQIYEFFKNPQIVDTKPMFGSIDKEKIKALLCDEHDFSEERIDSALSKERPSQKSLSSWLRK
jgi:flap endonuclease-1